MSSHTPSISARGTLAALLGLAGALHLMVADTRGTAWNVEGVALAVIGLLSIGLSVAIIVARGRWPLIGVIGLMGTVIAALVVTRTSGYLTGPFRNFTAPLGSFEILVLVVGALTLSMGGAMLVVGRPEPPGWRFETLAPLAVVAAALPGIAMSSWTDDAAYFAGPAHVHSGTTIDSSTRHGLAYRAELTLDERERLGDEVSRARAAALSTPTLADALAAGWTRVGPRVSGAGQMVIDLERRSGDATFDPARPAALMFASGTSDAPIVAVQYEVWTSSTTPPPGFTGQDMFWHLHIGTCIVDGIRIVYDEPHVGKNCAFIDGDWTNTISWMIRAWVVPGWENPNGTFAHDHPGLR